MSETTTPPREQLPILPEAIRDTSPFTTDQGILGVLYDLFVNGQYIKDEDGNIVGVQTPFSTDGDSVYVKDLDIEECSTDGFTGGDITDLFNDLGTELVNSTTDNPKTIIIKFKRAIATTGISIGTESAGTHSNLKIEALRGGNTYTTVRDGSASSIPFNSRFYSISATAGNSLLGVVSVTGFRLTFNTSNPIAISNIFINKVQERQTSLLATNPDGIQTYIGATRYDNLKVSLQEYGDTPAVDAFGRLRSSDPFTIFDSKQLHDKQPLFWDEILFGTDAVSEHVPIDAEVRMGVGLTVGEYVIRQTYQRFNYQPGKSQLFFMTFHASASDGAVKRIGAFDGTGENYMSPFNGVFFEVNGGVYWNIAKNGAIAERVEQADWNVDRLDGNGRSGITLDLSAAQIMVMDLEWLGVGRARVGFVIDGALYYVHYFNHANNPLFKNVYMSTPNLPLRYDILSNGEGDINQADLWTPQEITTQAWFDASDELTINESGGDVQSWGDKSGNGYEMTPPGGGEPRTGDNTLGGLNVITFDGTQRLRSNNNFSWPTSGNMMGISVKRATIVDSASDSFWGWNTTVEDAQFRANSATQFNGQMEYNGTGNTPTAYTGGPFSGYFLSAEVHDWSNNDYLGYINGTLDADGTGNYTQQITDGAGSRSMSLMASYNGGNQIAGDMAEIVFVDSNDTATRQIVEGYLAWKWDGGVAGPLVGALPVGHPYKDNPPRTGAVTHLDHICSTVISEGGIEKTGVLRSVENADTFVAGYGTQKYALTGVRLKEAYQDISVLPESVQLVIGTNDAFKWEVQINPTISGSITWNDLTNSSVQYFQGVLANGITADGIIIARGGGSTSSRGADSDLQTALRIGASIAGVSDTLVLVIRPFGSNLSVWGALNFRELL